MGSSSPTRDQTQVPPVLGVQTPSHWTTREVPKTPLFLKFYFWPYPVACRIFLRSGMEARSQQWNCLTNHWTTREVPNFPFLGGRGKAIFLLKDSFRFIAEIETKAQRFPRGLLPSNVHNLPLRSTSSWDFSQMMQWSRTRQWWWFLQVSGWILWYMNNLNRKSHTTQISTSGYIKN